MSLTFSQINNRFSDMKFKVGVLCLPRQPGQYWDRSSAFATCGSQTQTQVTACDQMPNVLTTRSLRTIHWCNDTYVIWIPWPLIKRSIHCMKFQHAEIGVWLQTEELTLSYVKEKGENRVFWVCRDTKTQILVNVLNALLDSDQILGSCSWGNIILRGRIACARRNDQVHWSVSETCLILHSLCLETDNLRS